MSRVPNTNPAAAELRELREMLSYQRGRTETLEQGLTRANVSIQSLLNSRAVFPAAPVANLLWNGEVGHSVNSWHDTAYVVTDKAKEAAWWFSHNKPVSGRQEFSTISTNDEIPITGHGFTTGQTVDFTTDGTLPTGLSAGTTYFVIVLDDDTFSVASTVANAFAGTAVGITAGTGSGKHYAQEQLIPTDARTSATNNTLKTTGHSTYLAEYSRWNSENGWGELTDTKTIDQILPSNLIDATTSLARVSMIAAKRNQYIELPSDCVMGAGIWDNTSGQRQFLTGSLGLTGEVIGAPASTCERRYRILITSDRGYSLLSQEITLASAPQDGEFTTTDYVLLTWRFQPGQLQAEIYEYLPAGGDGASAPEYRYLAEVSSSTSYIHLGTFLPKSVGGYPTASGTVRSATFFTLEGEMSGLATNSLSPSWSTVNFPIGVPDNYDKSNTTDRQWLRLWLSVAPNLFVAGCTTDGSTTITAPAAVFEAEYDALFDAGNLVAEVYDSNDSLIVATTVVSRTDDENIVLADSVASGTNRKLRIVGGGFHGVLIDKIHLGYQQNTSYAPNPFDARTLQPVAAPSSSTQGGVGTGGTGGGIFSCVASHTPIKQFSGEWLPIWHAEPGDGWASASVFANALVKLRTGLAPCREVWAANGCFAECTDTERFLTSPDDVNGTPLFRLRVGDLTLTEIDGRVEYSRIAYIGPPGRPVPVYSPSLTDSHVFIGGIIRPRNPLQRLWYWMLSRLQKRQIRGGFLFHNLKPYDDPGGPFLDLPTES